MKKQVTSKSIDGVTDLVVWAPIREGFIDAFENVTYATRLRIVSEALHAIRKSAREHEKISPFADTAERILTLLDFCIGTVDDGLLAFNNEHRPTRKIKPRKYMYLVATFGGAWEPYMRLIWKPLGPFLDLVLCNCEGYVPAVDSSFEEYANWVRNHQLDSAIFYSTSGLTVKDNMYLSKLERIHRSVPSPVICDDAIAKMTSDVPETLAAIVRGEQRLESHRLALEALTVLYKLADFYPPTVPMGTGAGIRPAHQVGDGRFLLRAAHELLKGWAPDDIPKIWRDAFVDPLVWFGLGPAKSHQNEISDPPFDASQIQKGLLTGYDSPDAPITHGALLLMQVTDPEKARLFIEGFPVDWEGTKASTPGGPFDDLISNIALTFDGLKQLGVPKAELDLLPKEFREGMSERAGLIGDVRENHPRNWRLPQRNFPLVDANTRPPVELDEVDFLLQLRTSRVNEKGEPAGIVDFAEIASDEFEKTRHELDGVTEIDIATLHSTFDSFTAKYSERNSNAGSLEIVIAFVGIYGLHFGVSLLSVQSMYRSAIERTPDSRLGLREGAVLPRGHFGFVDGLSQPEISDDPHRQTDCRRGDILCGYRNMRDDGADGNTERLTFNGSFLAIRKMRQDVAAFNAFLQENQQLLPVDDLAARVVGREKNGAPLIGEGSNEFNYTSDEDGEKCPFSSHIRRANPRGDFQGRKDPMILRRGMSYGRRYGEAPDDYDRGLIFMAYNSSLAEQYEVIQNWINGANSTNVAAVQNDPLMGVQPKTGKNIFRFMNNGSVVRTQIKKPFVYVEWGAYLFAPSRKGLETICRAGGEPVLLTSSERGERAIHEIERFSLNARRREWKTVLEDGLTKDPREDGVTVHIWEAIRNKPGGAYIVDGGIEGRTKIESEQRAVLVADEGLISNILGNTDFSVKEQGARVAKSFGPIYVARDPGKKYLAEAAHTNAILMKISKRQAFDVAYSVASNVLGKIQKRAEAANSDFIKLELQRQFLAPVLGEICRFWFDIPDDKHIRNGAWNWNVSGNDDTPRCPGSFFSPSRHAFYPRPTQTIANYGMHDGKVTRKSVDKIVAKLRRDGAAGKISAPMFAAIKDDDMLARNLIGVMTGALPPLEGNFRAILFEWLASRSLWRHQGAYHRAIRVMSSEYDAARSALFQPIAEAISKRPAPDLIYRTATRKVSIRTGDTVVHFKENDLVILSSVAVMQGKLADGKVPDITPVFGGYREKPIQDAGKPIHACPAYQMSVGTLMGVMAGLLDGGRIQALPASLIVKITDW